MFVSRDLGLSARGLAEVGFPVLRLPAPAAEAEPLGDDAPAHAVWLGVPQGLDAEQTCAALAAWGADWIVVDSYACDARWHAQARALSGVRVAVIDDLADRPLQADLLVDHNLGDHRTKYATQLQHVGRLLGGPRFALLDPAYEDPPTYRFNAQVRSIGVFMGGTDPWNASEAAVRACTEVARFSGRIEVAVSGAHPHLPRLQALCAEQRRLSLLLDAPQLDEFFARHDLQIGAAGGAAWERCRIGAPTLAVAMADNQREPLAQLAAAGAAWPASSADPQVLGPLVARLIADPEARAQISERARALVDGRGAGRVALALLADAMHLRPAVADDAARVYPWRNAEVTRRHFRDPSALAWESHRDWWLRCIADPARRLLIASCGSRDVGVFRLDLSGASAEVSLYLDPALHGLGLGAALLQAGQRWVREREAGLARLVAEVLPGNVASSAAFDAVGFVRDQGSVRTWEVPR